MQRRNELKFGFPIGAIQEGTIELFRAAGYDIKFCEEFQKVAIDDPTINCILTRPIPMVSFVEKGFLDAGISTQASVLEAKADITQICELGHTKPALGKTKVVLAVPQNSKIKSLKDLDGKRIITRVPNIAKEFLEKNKISAEIMYSDAPINESMAGVVGEGIVEFTRAGNYLKAYNLKILAVLLESSVILITNKKALKNKWKKEKIESLGILLKGTRLAEEMAGLILHASNEIMERVLDILPALKKPTVTQLRGENWFEVLTVATKKEIRQLIPMLKKIGCINIVEFPLNKVIP